MTEKMRITWAGSNTRVVNATADHTSDLVDLRWTEDQNLALYFKATSVAGAPDLLFEYKVSPNAVWRNAGYWVEDPHNPLVTPAGAATIVDNSVAETQQQIVFSIEGPTKWLAIKVTGNAGNQTDTIVTAYLQAI